VGADGRDGRDFVSVAEEKGADTAGRDTFALALNEVAHRGDVDPTPIRRSDRIAGVHRLWLESQAGKPAGCCPRCRAEPSHLGAARSARSCMTLMAPTVEFISFATSFNEYPCRKRSSRTRR